MTLYKKIAALFLALMVLLSAPAFAANTFDSDFRDSRGYTWKVEDFGNRMQLRCDYGARTDGQPVYLGYAFMGKASSADAWRIYKFTYDGSDQVTLKQIADGTWDNRASLTYA